MRILYGVQGTGNGHLTRARVLAKAFKRAGVQVDYLFSGRASDQFFDMDDFGAYQWRQGLTFCTANGKVQVGKTARHNNLWRCWRDIKQLDLQPYDLVVNDFEPISAWAAKQQRVACIGVSHQKAFLQPVPVAGDGFINQVVMKYFAPSTTSLGCHWHHFDCNLLPPIIEPITATAEQHNRVLVYLPFESADEIAQQLAGMPHQHFSVFHGQPPVAIPPNVSWHSFSRDAFQHELAGCSGVICSAGFGLVSEALVLGKKLLLKPLHGQFEQLSNALALELLGAASVMKQLDKADIERWLPQPQGVPVGYPPMGDAIVEWLLAGRWDDVSSLCQRSWQRSQLPEAWLHKWVTAY